MQILLAGDCHGHLDYLRFAMHRSKLQFPDIELCIQVGDFGFYPSVIEGHLRNVGFPYKLIALDGNHENHTYLQKHFDHEFAASRNLFHVPRGTVQEIGGRKIGFLGGAMNVDRAQEGKTKLGTQNFISKQNVKDALEEFNKHDLDMMITHSCPHGIGVGMSGHEFFLPTIKKHILIPYSLEPTDILDCGEHALKDLWDGLVNKPKKWIYGHFHTTLQSKVDNTEFLCIGCTDMTDNYNHPSFLPLVYDIMDDQIYAGDRISYPTQAPKNEKREFR